MLGDQEIRLRPDGTFSIRMAFKDGMIHVPINAQDNDTDLTEKITMRFERVTHRLGEMS